MAARSFSSFLLFLLVILVLQSVLCSARLLNPYSHTSSKRSDDKQVQSLDTFLGSKVGDDINGLGRLKKYLSSLGYLPSYQPTIATSEDNHFDEQLETAIKVYQLNYNLNITGILDKPTLEQILVPRCGVPDIINGKTSMNSGKSHHHNSSRISTSQFSFFSGAPRWAKSSGILTYAFDQSASSRLVPLDLSATISRAFSKWESVTNFKFQEVADTSSSNIVIGFYTGAHGDDSPFDGRGGILAHAYAPPTGLFHIDADEEWDINQRRDAFDLESVSVHEIGHLLGLGHSSFSDAIMFPTLSQGTRKVDLSMDDIIGIKTLYFN